MIQRRLGWALSAQVTEPTARSIERGCLELDLSVGHADILKYCDELVTREVVIALPGIVPVIRDVPPFEDVMEPVRLDPIHVLDEATEGRAATDQ